MEISKMKPTQEELQLKSGDELDELVAIAQGWKIERSMEGGRYVGATDDYVCSKCDYHPTQNTTEGKAQCWKLAVKCELIVDLKNSVGAYVNGTTHNKNPQKAVVIAAILSLMEESK